jgi:photosystem II stability/assembly factor-like uncharacterized protein
MNIKYLFSCFLSFLFFTCSNQEIQVEELPQSPDNWQTAQRIYPSGNIDQEAIASAKAWKKIAAQNSSASRSMDQEWEFVGPTNIGGRVTDIEIPAGSPETIYVGSAAGGVFKTVDNGDNWQAIFDDAGSLAIGDIALAPTNQSVVYVGTGEANGGGGSLTFDGDGIYRSTDAGETWANIGLNEVGTIGRVAVSPTDENTLFVAATGNLFSSGPERGIYRTTNAGQNWEKVLFVNDQSGGVDLAIHPTNPDIIFAATWERTRSVSTITYGGEGSGIHRSLDGGDTWQELTNGLPSDPAETGRIALAIATSEPNVIYASYAASGGQYQGLYRSEDGGGSWQEKASQSIISVPFMWWFGRITVDPTNSETVYNSGWVNQRSRSGGDLWEEVFVNAHVDQHCTFIDPSNPDRVLVGNDGGIFESLDKGETFRKINGLPITQFYNVEIDPQDETRLFGGTQDNSPMRNVGGEADDWEIIFGGDGFFTVPDPSLSNIVYTSSQSGNFQKSVENGDPGTFVSKLDGVNPTDRRNWRTPYVIDPRNPEKLYYGTYRMYASDDRGEQWNMMSQDLTNGNQSVTRRYGTITTISPSPILDELIFVGTDDGHAWRSDDDGANWRQIDAGLPNRWVTSITASANEAEEVFITFSGYRFGEDSGHVYKSTNRGETWERFDMTLPEVPVNEVINVGAYLFLATDIGVFTSRSDVEDWQLLGTGLPNVVVTDLAYHIDADFLLAGTYGRSAYRIDVGELVKTSDLPDMLLSAKTYPNPMQSMGTIRFELETTQQMKLALFDLSGRELRQVFSGELTAGIQELPIDVSGLTPGAYFVRGIVAGKGFGLPLVVQ